MRNLLPAILIATTTILSSGCHDEGENLANIKRMEDTLFKSYPTMAGVSVEVRDWHELNIVARSAQLYNTTEENQLKVTGEIEKIAQSVFGTNNELDKGQVIFTKDEKSTDMNPKDGKAYPLTFPEK